MSEPNDPLPEEPRPNKGARTRASDRGPAWFVLPLLLFVVGHGALNAIGATSESTFVAVGRFAHGSWWNTLVLCGFVWIPLVGTLVYALRGHANARSPDGARAARRTPVAVVAGSVALVFMAWHVWDTSVQRALGRRSLTDLFYDLVASLSSTVRGVPVVALGYLIGSAAVLTFLAFASLDAWSVLAPKSAGAPRRKLWVTVIACAVYLVIAGTVVKFATGAALP